MVENLMQQEKIPGLQVAVFHKDQIVWSQGFGYADIENKVSVWPATKMRIGSVSKTLTATALGILYEEGRLDLDAPVREYVPYFPQKRHEISTRQVAGHLAGIRHYRGEEFLIDQRYTDVSRALSIFAGDSLLHAPGEQYHYSSYGWNLISAVVEGASGENFLSYMRRNVFKPLEMRSTVADHTDSLIYHRTSFYEITEDGNIVNAPYVDNSYKWAGGGFLGTAENLIAFGRAVFWGDFLEQETVDKLVQSQKTNDGEETGYGIGWSSGTDSRNRTFYGHSGGSVGGTTRFTVFPEQQVIVAMIANLGGVDYDGIHLQIADLFMKEISDNDKEE